MVSILEIIKKDRDTGIEIEKYYKSKKEELKKRAFKIYHKYWLFINHLFSKKMQLLVFRQYYRKKKLPKNIK